MKGAILLCNPFGCSVWHCNKTKFSFFLLCLGGNSGFSVWEPNILVRPAGSKKTESEEEKMEQRMAAVEKFTSEQLKWNSEIRAEILGLKEGVA